MALWQGKLGTCGQGVSANPLIESLLAPYTQNIDDAGFTDREISIHILMDLVRTLVKSRWSVLTVAAWPSSSGVASFRESASELELAVNFGSSALSMRTVPLRAETTENSVKMGTSV